MNKKNRLKKLIKSNTGVGKIAILIILSMLTLWSCKKDKLNPDTQEEQSYLARTSMNADGGITIDVEDGDVDYAEIKHTIVGNQYDFPFKVETIKQA